MNNNDLKPISFDSHAIAAIENTSVGMWPPQARDFDKPIMAVTRRPVEGQIPADSGVWVHEGSFWRFVPEQGEPTRIQSPWGTKGDRLWISETWSTFHEHNHLGPEELPPAAPIFFSERLWRGGTERPAEDLPFGKHRYEATVQEIRIERLSQTTESGLSHEGIYSCSDCVRDDWNAERNKKWNDAYGSSHPAESDPWIFRIALMFHPVNRKCEVFVNVGLVGEGSFVVFTYGNGEEKELHTFDINLSPEDIDERAREIAAELGAEFRGWFT